MFDRFDIFALVLAAGLAGAGTALAWEPTFILIIEEQDIAGLAISAFESELECLNMKAALAPYIDAQGVELICKAGF